MRKIFSFSAKILLSCASGILAASVAEKIFSYHLAFACAYLFAALVSFYIIEISLKKIF